MLNVENLKTYFYTVEGVVKAVDGATFTLNKGENLGLAGESGSGKSTVAYSILRLVPYPGRIVDGKIVLEDENLLEKNIEEMRKIRGSKIAMIFQNPMSALNPVFTIEYQIGEAFQIHQNLKKKTEISGKVIEILDKVGIPNPAERMKGYPHEFSGGMRQRVVIAIAVSCNPSLLIADEPTTNLDVTIQAQIIELMKEIRKEFNTSTILITHDMGLIAEFCDKVAIMYAGKIMEYADVQTIFRKPRHPYTTALLKSIPGYEEEMKRFHVIRGSVPSLINPPLGCRFHPRCDFATEICSKKEPQPVEIGRGHITYCFKPDELE